MSDIKDTKDNQKDDGQDEAVFHYVTKKLEKVTSALYLITNFFPEREPLRNSIRQKSLNLLSNTFSLKEKIVSDPAHFKMSVISTMKEIVSLLGVARKSGLISDMNYGVLESEFDGLLETLGASRESSPLPELSGSFFSVDEEYRALASGSTSQSRKNTSTKPQKSTSTARKNKPVSKTKSKRRDQIIALLDDKGEVSITDISDEIQGCSQKTIQRELSALIDAGEVVKEGERRWSRYRLAEGVRP